MRMCFRPLSLASILGLGCVRDLAHLMESSAL
ncbi:MAG: hypothetical protein JWN23_1106 [Rhodocyclales bacterium]|nr:hypothetical protein [Rhodocyclales bacterium]